METKDLFDKFKLTIDQEYESYELFKNISEKSDHVVTKEIFGELAQDEFKHRKTTMELYKKAKEQSSDISK